MASKDTSPLNVANSLYDTSVTEEAQLEAQLLAQREAQAQFEAQQKAQLDNIAFTQLVGSTSKNPTPQVGVVTRSQTTDSFEHQELTFTPTQRVKKMAVTIKLEDAFKLIPLCTGVDDVYQFINACVMAVSLVEADGAP